jgi:hypothetical protein
MGARVVCHSKRILMIMRLLPLAAACDERVSADCGDDDDETTCTRLGMEMMHTHTHTLAHACMQVAELESRLTNSFPFLSLSLPSRRTARVTYCNHFTLFVLCALTSLPIRAPGWQLETPQSFANSGHDIYGCQFYYCMIVFEPTKNFFY